MLTEIFQSSDRKQSSQVWSLVGGTSGSASFWLVVSVWLKLDEWRWCHELLLLPPPLLPPVLAAQLPCQAPPTHCTSPPPPTDHDDWYFQKLLVFDSDAVCVLWFIFLSLWMTINETSADQNQAALTRKTAAVCDVNSFTLTLRPHFYYMLWAFRLLFPFVGVMQTSSVQFAGGALFEDCMLCLGFITFDETCMFPKPIWHIRWRKSWENFGKRNHFCLKREGYF